MLSDDYFWVSFVHYFFFWLSYLIDFKAKIASILTIDWTPPSKKFILVQF